MTKQITLPFTIDATGRIASTDNLAKQLADNIVSIVGTQPGQRRMQPGYGVDLEGYLFQPLTPGTIDRLTAEIEVAVALAEPRVTITNVSDLSTPGEGLLGVEIDFTFVTATDPSVTQSYTAIISPGGVLS